MIPYSGAGRLDEDRFFKRPSRSRQCSHHQEQDDKTCKKVKDNHIIVFGYYKYNLLVIIYKFYICSFSCFFARCIRRNSTGSPELPAPVCSPFVRIFFAAFTSRSWVT